MAWKLFMATVFVLRNLPSRDSVGERSYSLPRSTGGGIGESPSKPSRTRSDDRHLWLTVALSLFRSTTV